METPRGAVVETQLFLRSAQQTGLLEAERPAIVDLIAADPERGDVVRGSGGIRKVRFAGRGKGTSGGYRVLVGYFGVDYPLLLLAVSSKGDRADFTNDGAAKLRRLADVFKSEIGKRKMR